MNPIRALYQEALDFYGTSFHARIALSLSILSLIGIPVWTRIGYAETLCVSCPADYSILAVWLVIVPITGMALINYHLVMKPILERKKTGRNGRIERGRA